MRPNYKQQELPEWEKRFHEAVLMEQIDVQRWFVIVIVEINKREIFINLQ